MCEHPIQTIVDREEESPLGPGDDCWGFQPYYPVSVCADIAGAILSQNYDEWAVRPYSRTAVTVYGRDPERNESKVRIGHDGVG